jgi:acyl-CoA synthetase (AMP-forming)/AMP-acid ligase II
MNFFTILQSSTFGMIITKIIIGFFSDDSQPVTICVLPLYHIYALNVTMGPGLWAGGQIVCLPKFDPKSFVKAMEVYKVFEPLLIITF